MTKTGKDFDMNPDTFTLDNLFTMQLHNFADTINEIVTSAVKELSIEKGLKEVWKRLYMSYKADGCVFLKPR